MQISFIANFGTTLLLCIVPVCKLNNKQTKKNMKQKQQASSVRLIEFDLNVDWSFPESIIAN